MRGLIVRIGVTGAGGLLALGLLAGPSAAKGSDKHNSDGSSARQSNQVTCFHPEGKTQGRSMSDPDGDENGGADKPSPDCTGGVNLDDRDGNNGCGNDADREDDNNGNCGSGDARTEVRPRTGERDDDDCNVDRDDDAGRDDEGDCVKAGGDDADVNAEQVDAEVKVQAAGSGAGVLAAEATPESTTVAAAGDTTPSTETPAPATQTEVLGETLSAPDTSGTLARTGAGVGGLALLGGLLVGGGRLTVLARKLLRIG